MPHSLQAWQGLSLSGGRYQVHGKLGGGGMGVDYRAHDEMLISGREDQPVMCGM